MFGHLGPGFFSAIMSLENADGMENTVDPVQTALSGHEQSDLALHCFSQTNLSKYLEVLWYLELLVFSRRTSKQCMPCRVV